MLGFNTAFSQGKKYYYIYTPEQIENNVYLNFPETCNYVYFNDFKNTFEIGEITAFEFFEGDPLVFQLIYSGGFMNKRNYLICYDIEKCITLEFKQIDNYTIQAMNNIDICKKGTKLYLHYQEYGESNEYRVFYEPKDLITSDYWKTGIKNGIHQRYDNETYKLYYYKDNILADSVVLSMYDSDSANIVKEVFFIERYGNTNNFSNYYHNDLKLILCRYYYLLIKEDNFISVGEFEEYRDSEDRFFAEYRDINGKYEFTLSEKDNSKVVDSFKSNSSDSEVVLNVGDIFQMSQ